MPMDGNMIDKNVGEHQYKTLTYISDESIQQKTRYIARCQENKAPQKLGGLALLFFISIASDIYRAKNAQEGLPSPPKSVGRHNRSRITTATQHVCQTEQSIKPWYLFSLPGAMGSIIPKATQITTTSPSSGVEITKLDYTCIEERATPSITNMIRKVADTLDSTVSETINEFSVLANALQRVPCPNENDRNILKSITGGIDEIINFAIDRNANLNIIAYLKIKLPAFLRVTCDLIDSHQVVVEKFEEISSSLVKLYKMTFHFPPIKSDSTGIINRASIPEYFHLKNGHMSIDINNKTWSLVNENEQYYAVRNNVYHWVTYDRDAKVWMFLEDEFSTDNHHFHDQFYTRCTTTPHKDNSSSQFCRIITNAAPELPAPHSHNLPEIQHSADHKAILARFDIGLSKDSPDVEKLHFANHWVVYRVRIVERGMQKFLHVIEINGRLIPVRARKISSNRVRCEIYNRKRAEENYCAEFHNGQWRIESSSSMHISINLNAMITRDMYEYGINSIMLSSPDEKGIKVNRNGDEFIQHENNFIKLKKDNQCYFLTATDGTRLNLSFRFEQFHFASAQTEDGILTLTPLQYNNHYDTLINSAGGLDQYHGIILNKNWIILSSKIKASVLRDDDDIGSKIDITLRFRCKKTLPDTFHDIPHLVWNSEEIFKDENKKSYTKMDMYKQKEFSELFSAWHKRYVAAYYYAISSDKNPKHSRVRIYDNDRNPLYSNEFPLTSSEENMAEHVKFYFSRLGGLLDITISMRPHIKIVEPLTSLERVIHYTIGFPGLNVLNISQGIVIDKNEPKHVFVSCSNQIALAE